MKVAVVFYSFSGNTESAAAYIKEELEKKGISCTLFPLRPRKETRSFWRQCFKAMTKAAEAISLDMDPRSYGLVLFASPVWAFSYTPPLRQAVRTLHLAGSKAVLILTYGSGAGKEKARRELQKDLEARGVQVVFSALLRGRNCRDKDYLGGELAPFFDIDEIKNAPVAQLDRAQASGA